MVNLNILMVNYLTKCTKKITAMKKVKHKVHNVGFMIVLLYVLFYKQQQKKSK
jgi:hypothetical protein